MPQEPGPHANDVKQKELALKERELDFTAWRAVVEVQMHFNEILMRVRNVAITLLLGAFGAGTFTLQYDLYFRFFGKELHIAVFLLSLGLVGWFVIGLLDWGYYHRLLIGAVRKSTEIEEKHKEDVIFGMTGYITEESRRVGRHKIKARHRILAFYMIVLLIGAIYTGVVATKFKGSGPNKNSEEVAAPARHVN